MDNLWEAVDASTVCSSDLEQGILKGWQAKVNMEENSLRELLNKIDRKISLMSTPAIQHSGDGTSRDNNVDQAARKTAVDTEVDFKIIREKAVALSNEVKEAEDWTEAEDNVVEEYMGKVDGWKKMLDMLKDKVDSLEKVTTLHSLDHAMLEAVKGLVKKLESETLMVIEEIKNEHIS